MLQRSVTLKIVEWGLILNHAIVYTRRLYDKCYSAIELILCVICLQPSVVIFLNISLYISLINHHNTYSHNKSETCYFI